MIAGKSLWSVNGPWNDDKKVNIRRIGNFSFSPSVCLSICSSLSVFLSVCPSIWLSVAISLSLRRIVCLSLWLSLFQSVCLAVYSFMWLSIALSVSPSDCLSLRLTVCLSVCLSVFRSVCLSVCLSVYPWVRLSGCRSNRSAMRSNFFVWFWLLPILGIPFLHSWRTIPCHPLELQIRKKTFLRHLFTSLKDYKTFLRWRNTNLPAIE